jgi:hypothetical protein
MVIRCSNGIELDRANKTVTHAGESYAWRPQDVNRAFDTFCFVLLSDGVSKEQVFFHIYGDDPDGGPLEGPHIFHIVLNRLDKEFFDRLQIEWRSWRIAGVHFYSIVPRHQFLDPRLRNHMYVNLRRRPPIVMDISNA